MDAKKLGSTLHPLERKVLPFLSERKSIDELVAASGLQQVEVVRALQWLENKKLVEVFVEQQEIVSLDDNGLDYSKKGLPEKRFLDSLSEKHSALSNVAEKSGLTGDEVNVCIGVLRKNGLIDLKKGTELSVAITKKGAKERKSGFAEEKFIGKTFPLLLSELSREDIQVLDSLRKRKKIVLVELRKEKAAKLTDLGEKVAKASGPGADVMENVSSEIIKSRAWEGKEFRRYDVTAQVPKISGGRRHFVSKATNYIRKIWVDMGFTEMDGPMLQTAFWNMDALFTPQDHPARELQDTFYVKSPGIGRVPVALAKKVKAVHENGADTGSVGYGGEWSAEIAAKNLLRTHTTVLSAQTLARLKLSDLPAKFFAVGRVFRNETLDWKHLFEFSQVEGIVVDPDANLRHLFGYLKEFYKKMGFTNVRMVPHYFPYTEPSVEVFAFHPIKKEWVEVGGAGIFRTEVTKPLLGHDIPVLAWGQGLERIITEYYKITDLRVLYRNDVRQLREIKEWTR